MELKVIFEKKKLGDVIFGEILSEPCKVAKQTTSLAKKDLRARISFPRNLVTTRHSSYFVATSTLHFPLLPGRQKSPISKCVGFDWRFREWSRSSQRIQNPGSRWIHCGGGPSSRGFGEAWEGRSANGQSQVSGTPSIFFPNTISEK